MRAVRGVLLATSGIAGTIAVVLSRPDSLVAVAAIAIVFIVVLAACWTLADKERSLRLAMLIRALRSSAVSSPATACLRRAELRVPETVTSILTESAPTSTRADQ